MQAANVTESSVRHKWQGGGGEDREYPHSGGDRGSGRGGGRTVSGTYSGIKRNASLIRKMGPRRAQNRTRRQQNTKEGNVRCKRRANDRGEGGKELTA